MSDDSRLCEAADTCEQVSCQVASIREALFRVMEYIDSPPKENSDCISMAKYIHGPGTHLNSLEIIAIALKHLESETLRVAGDINACRYSRVENLDEQE